MSFRITEEDASITEASSDPHLSIEEPNIETETRVRFLGPVLDPLKEEASCFDDQSGTLTHPGIEVKTGALVGDEESIAKQFPVQIRNAVFESREDADTVVLEPPPPNLKTEKLTKKFTKKQTRVFTRIITFVRPLRKSLSSRFSLNRRTTSTDVVTLKQFTDAASCKTDILPRRIYKVLRNEGGEVTKESLIEATTGRLVEEISFAYDVYDMDGDGELSKEDFRIALKACLEENNIQVETTLTEKAIDSVFERLDPEGNGVLDYDVFKEYFEGSSESLSQSIVVRKSEDWIPKFSPVGSVQQIRQGVKQFGSYIAKRKEKVLNNREKFALWTLSILCCVGCFYWRFATYAGTDAQKLMSWSLPIAKGMGQVMKFCFAVILLPVSRNAVTCARNSWLSRVLPFDDAISFHKFIGRVGYFAATTHSLCHVVNVVNWSDTNRYELYRRAFPDEEHQPTLLELCTSLVAVTGILLQLIMCIACLFALDYPRKWKAIQNTRVAEVLNNFNYFWFSHHLFAVFYILLIIHPLPGISSESNESGVSDFWLWGGVPILIYLLERGLRVYRKGSWQTKILHNEKISSDTVTIRLTKPRRFNAKAGMYVFLNCPEIAKFEWHPYTLTSAPQDDHLSVHIASLGDWSSAMNKKFELPIQSQITKERSSLPQLEASSPRPDSPIGAIPGVGDPLNPGSIFKESSPRIFVDGPYGAPCQEFDHFSTVMLIGAGIGITPFASILRDLLARFDDHRCSHCGKVSLKKSFRVKKVYFIWAARDPRYALWFNRDLHALKADDQDGILDVQIFITGVQPSSDVRSKLLFMTQKLYFEKSGVDLLTGSFAHSLTNIGRPDWTRIFEKASVNHPDTTIGVFFCGQHVLGNILERNCRKYSGRNGTKFEYMYERF